MAMADNTILFGRTYTLADGVQVRFRLAGPGDHLGVAALVGAEGAELDQLEVVRLLRTDPRRQAMVCATALLGARETVLGFAAAPLIDGTLAGESSLVISDQQLGNELRELLVHALTTRLRGASPRRAVG
jgi:hypothetical protein